MQIPGLGNTTVDFIVLIVSRLLKRYISKVSSIS